MKIKHMPATQVKLINKIMKLCGWTYDNKVKGWNKQISRNKSKRIHDVLNNTLDFIIK